jgi:hypothetical protein
MEPIDIFLLIRLGVWGGAQPPLFLRAASCVHGWSHGLDSYRKDRGKLDAAEAF